MTAIDVCNQALAHIGDRRVVRLDAEAQATDPYARYCVEFLDASRREVLSAHRWTFATKFAVLTRRTGVPVIGEFAYQHVRPSDCLRVLTLIPGTSFIDGLPTAYNGRIDKFKVINKDIKSNHLHVALEYMCDLEVYAEWTPHAITALSRLLASYLAGSIANAPDMAANHRRHYESVDLPNAQYYDAVQDKSGENEESATRRAGSPLLMSRFNTGYDDQGPLDA